MDTNTNRTARRLAATVATGMMVVSGSPSTASAEPERGTFPGENGILTFARIDASGGIDLISMWLDGTHRRVLVRSPGDSVSVFSGWSPDGRRLVFDRERADGNIDIHLRRPGGRIVRLTDDVVRDAHPTWRARAVSGSCTKVTGPDELSSISCAATAPTYDS